MSNRWLIWWNGFKWDVKVSIFNIWDDIKFIWGNIKFKKKEINI